MVTNFAFYSLTILNTMVFIILSYFWTTQKEMNMKKILSFAFCVTALAVNAQIITPQPSPAATVKQTVGITEIEVAYSRPAKKGRVIFGDLVMYDAIWRTGANKNTMITTSDVMIFGKDTLAAGTYAIFTKPGKSSWEIYFYTDTENWGTPEKWDDSKVALKAKAEAINKSESVESFTIGFENVMPNGAVLSFSWDKVDVNLPFSVATTDRVLAAIEKTMAGPSSADYYRAAEFYLNEKKDLKQALEWINKSIEMNGNAPFWILRRKSLIQAELGDYKGAIETAKISLDGAMKAGNRDYENMNKTSIEEWSKK